MTTAKSRIKFNISVTRILSIALFAFVACLGGVREAEAAAWQNNPNSCPIHDDINYPAQHCGVDVMCGVSTGIVQCISPGAISAPVASAVSSVLYSAAFGGGYVLDCEAASDAAAPFCDNSTNAWCNRDATCFGGGNNRLTTCVGGKWQSDAAAFTCGACLATHLDCGGDTKCEIQINTTNYPTGAGNHYGTGCAAVDARCDTGVYDCDATGVTVGNGCEATRTGACIGAGGFAGTWSCSVNAGGSCSDGGSNYNCVCAAPKCDFWTGDLCSYLTSNPLLWGRQFGDGDLIRMGNSATSSIFVVHNDGSIEMATTTAPADVTGKLYNVGGSLYWSGTLLANGATSTSGGLQSVTDIGNTTTHALVFAGGTSTGDFKPETDNMYSLGLAAFRWKDIYLYNLFASGTSIMENITVLGNVTTTNLYASGTTTLVNLFATNVSTTNFSASGTTFLNNLIVNNVTTTNLFSTFVSTTNLNVSGTSTLNNLVVNNVSTTNLTVTGTTTLNTLNVTNISASSFTINGITVTSVAATLQDVTDLGATTTHWLGYGGATSSGDLRPSADGTYSLGLSSFRWKDAYLVNLFLSGGLFDGTGATGTRGMVLLSTGTSTRWVATSTLGIQGSSLAAGAFGQTLYFDGTDWVATSTFNYASSGNIGIGMTAPGQMVTVGAFDSASAAVSKVGLFSVDNMLLAQLAGGAYFGRTGITENQWALADSARTWSQISAVANLSDVAMSSDGKIMAAVSSDPENIYVSYDFGKTWSAKHISATWVSVAMSADGRVMAAADYANNINVSYDFGATWNAIAGSGTRNWTKVAMSADGKYVAATVYDGLGTNYIYESADFGQTWSAKGTTANYIDIAVSSDGKVQTAVADSSGGAGGVFVSSDYGNTWIQTGASVPWFKVAMSADGKVQTAARFGGALYNSDDYGRSWSLNGSAGSRDWTGLSMSADGKTQFAVTQGPAGDVYRSEDFGATWQAGGLSGEWSAASMTSDGRVIAALEINGSIYVSYASSYTYGNIGINTSTPATMLHLQGGVAGSAVIRLDADDGSALGRDAGIIINADYVNGGDAANIKFMANNTETARFFSSGGGENGFYVMGTGYFSVNTAGQPRFAVDATGGVSIGPGSAADASAALDVTSNDRGVLLPRLLTAQRDAIVAPATGLILYNRSSSAFDYYDGSNWVSIATGTGSIATPDLQQVSDIGNSTTNRIQFRGATSTGDFNVTSVGGQFARILINGDDGSGAGGSARLELDGDESGGGDSAILLKGNGTTYGQIDGGTSGFRVTSFGLANMSFGTQSFAAHFIEATGRLGLGTSAPTSTLHVYDRTGTSTDPMLTLQNTAGTYKTFVTNQDPNGVVIGYPGDSAVDSAHGRHYIKQTGSGTNTGWIEVATGAVSATSTDAHFVGLSTSTYNGSFSAYGKTGYQAANAICDANFDGSHFCRTDEIIGTIADIDIAALFVSDTYGWIAEGPPGYTANSNDCTGYTTSDNIYLGAFWSYDPDGGGAGWLNNCSVQRKMSCCSK